MKNQYSIEEINEIIINANISEFLFSPIDIKNLSQRPKSETDKYFNDFLAQREKIVQESFCENEINDNDITWLEQPVE